MLKASALHSTGQDPRANAAAFDVRSSRSGRPRAAAPDHQSQAGGVSVTRRLTLGYLGCLLGCPPAFGHELPEPPELVLPASPGSAEECYAAVSRFQPGGCYAQQGPLLPLDLPKLEHTCTSCFPACVGDKCLLSIDVTYPKGGSLFGLSPPYPLAIFSGGFTVNSAAYHSTAARLASWGYTVVRYNTRDALPDVLDDVTCVKLLRELIDWAATHPLMRRLADTRRVYMTGHSRGAKLAALTAAVDPRVAALFLMDPVDVTQYAPLSDRFPSAAVALSSVSRSGRFLPVAVVGSGQAGDCAPRFNNYRSFFQAAPSVAWEVLLPAAGHFQYLDSSTALQRAVCGGVLGGPDDAAVRSISQAALVAWGEALVKLPGSDMVSCLAARCSSLLPPPSPPAAAAAGEAAVHAGGGGAVRGSSTTAGGWLPPPADVPLQVLHPQPTQQQQQQDTEAAGTAQASGAALHGSSQDQHESWWQQQRRVSGNFLAADNRQDRNAIHSQHKTEQSSFQVQRQVGQLDVLAFDNLLLLQQQQHQQPPQPQSQPQPQGDALLSALPQVQTRQDVWSASHAPSPSRLRQLRADLDRLLVAVSYQSSATVEVHSQFRNFG